MNFAQCGRMQAVQAPIVPVVADLIKRCPGTISLGQGVVGYGPPPSAWERMQTFPSELANNKYQSVRGIDSLVEVLGEKLRSENGIVLGSGSELVVTAGGNMAFLNSILAMTDPGDEVILQSPYYFNHEMAITLASCRPVVVPTDAFYQLRVGAIGQAITSRTRAVVTVSPNNPTGAVYAEKALREVNELCRARGIYHIHDEAYEYFTYDGARHFSPGSMAGSGEHTISLFSLSKAYGFASWRVGYMVIPQALFESVKKIQDTILICPPVISQWAAVGALEAGGSYCRSKLKGIEAVRQMVLEELNRVSDLCTLPTAQGAFYLLLRLHTQMEPMKVVERLIQKHRVAVMPGTAFGIGEGCYVRISYGALEPETAREGIGRFVGGVKEICGEEGGR